MNKRTIPVIIIIIQLLSLGNLYYVHRHKSDHLPVDFIMLNILAFFSLIILVIAYFLYFKADNKQKIWWSPIFLSVITILTLLGSYAVMFIDKYK
jgi:hypothetical protein